MLTIVVVAVLVIWSLGAWEVWSQAREAEREAAAEARHAELLEALETRRTSAEERRVLADDAAITVPATGLRPQARRRRRSRTARVTPQKDGRFKSVVISLCRLVDRPNAGSRVFP
jgi:type II secretory pathway pseudopilin PulG